MAQARRDKSVHDEELVVLHRIEKEISGKFVALSQGLIGILGADLFDQIVQIAELIREKLPIGASIGHDFNRHGFPCGFSQGHL